jgi:hypothetical protein
LKRLGSTEFKLQIYPSKFMSGSQYPSYCPQRATLLYAGESPRCRDLTNQSAPSSFDRIMTCKAHSATAAAVEVTVKGCPSALHLASAKMYAACFARASALNRKFPLSEACHGPERKRLGKLQSSTPCSVLGPLRAHSWVIERPLRPVIVKLAVSACVPT